jgi:excisionase family DNA binding protein
MDVPGGREAVPGGIKASRGHEKEEDSMPWLSIREGSELLRVSLRTVQRLVAAHALPSRMEHGRRLVLIGADEDRVRGTAAPGLTPALLPHLFDLLEGFTRLRLMGRRAVQHAHAAEPFQALPCMWNAPSMADWEKLSDRIVTCHQLVRGLVAELQLDQPVVHQVYQALIRIQLLWAEYEARSGEEEESHPTHQTQEHDPQILITQLIGQARALLTGCLRSRETPDVQRVSGDGVIGGDGGFDAGIDRDGGSGDGTDH